MQSLITTPVIIGAVVVGFVLIVIPAIVSSILRNVEAGTIRLVSWLTGGTVIYRGPGKSKEIPLLTTGTTISSKVINIDLDITDQTADIDESGTPAPIKVRVLASAIVSVGDTDALIRTAANRFFSKSDADQLSTLTDLLSSSGRRAMNLLTHDQLFSAKAAPVHALPPGESAALVPVRALPTALVPSEGSAIEDEDDPLAVIIRKACSRELTDLGLIFNSLNIKVVQSEVAESRRRQSAAEAQANADIVAANQTRRAKEAQLEAERAISDKTRELEQTKASNAALVAQAEAKRQEAAGLQRTAELDATQIAQAKADAARVRLEAEAGADAEAIRIRRIAEAQAESDPEGESGDRRGRRVVLPLSPDRDAAADRAGHRRRAGGREARHDLQRRRRRCPRRTTNNITSVIQTVLAAQLVSRGCSTDRRAPPPSPGPRRHCEPAGRSSGRESRR